GAGGSRRRRAATTESRRGPRNDQRCHFPRRSRYGLGCQPGRQKAPVPRLDETNGFGSPWQWVVRGNGRSGWPRAAAVGAVEGCRRTRRRHGRREGGKKNERGVRRKGEARRAGRGTNTLTTGDGLT